MTNTSLPPFSERPFPERFVAHTSCLLNSYRHWLGRDLVPRCGAACEDALTLFRADFVVVSHNTDPDPMLDYGNEAALRLWEMDLATLLATPSRLTAEPVHRSERERLLQRTKRNGFVNDYQGVRISASGQRFRIEQATVWNLFDEQGNHRGQAATFSDWHMLDSQTAGS